MLTGKSLFWKLLVLLRRMVTWGGGSGGEAGWAGLEGAEPLEPCFSRGHLSAAGLRGEHLLSASFRGQLCG